MSVVIRLQRRGTTKRPTYRVVVTDSRNPTDGKCLERVGNFYPQKAQEKEQLELNVERVEHWIGLGAQPSGTVRDLIRKAKKVQSK